MLDQDEIGYDMPKINLIRFKLDLKGNSVIKQIKKWAVA
jgi:hypothetical protein